jgi:hypothetical protein
MTHDVIAIAYLGPKCLFGLTPKFRDLGLSPEAANQRDLDESRDLMAEAYRRAVSVVSDRHGIAIDLQLTPFTPDEIAGRGMGGPVAVSYELINLLIESDLPVDVLTNLIADVILEAGKSFIAIARDRGITADKDDVIQPVSSGILSQCVQHALRTNRGDAPSDTSTSSGVTVATVGLREKELTYIVGRDGEPYAIVETSPSEIRLVSTDEWREWFLPESRRRASDPNQA